MIAKTKYEKGPAKVTSTSVSLGFLIFSLSTGTGFVYKTEDNTAYIMTNNHVISGGDSAKVIFSDGSVADTKIVGGETYSDIAVLTTSASNIKQVAIIGNTEKLVWCM